MGSLAVNVGSLHHRSSDTEGDFLDKDEIRKNTLKRVNQSAPGDDEYKSNMADDEYSLCSDMEQNRDKKTVKVIPLIFCHFMFEDLHFIIYFNKPLKQSELYGCFMVYEFFYCRF